MKPDRAYKVSKEHDEKEFKRELAIYLTEKSGTPTDILDSQFGAVEEDEKEYLFVGGKANVNYTCSVGYDRKEVYYENVKKYNSSTKSYYYEKKEKTRTVTDWSPYSGETSGEGSQGVPNCSDADRINYSNGNSARRAFASAQKESKEILDELPDINPEAMASAESSCIEACFNSVRLPGDRQKDKHYTGTVEVTRKITARMPEYKTSYEYNGKSYEAKGFAAGDVQVSGYYPSDSDKVEKSAKKSASWLKWLAAGLVILAIALLVILAVATDLSTGIITLIFMLLIAGAVVCVVFYFRIKKKKAQKMTADRKAVKKEALEEFLKKNDMAPLTEAEIATVDRGY